MDLQKVKRSLVRKLNNIAEMTTKLSSEIDACIASEAVDKYSELMYILQSFAKREADTCDDLYAEVREEEEEEYALEYSAKQNDYMI